MTKPLLDAPDMHQTLRKPIPWWRAGLWGGGISCFMFLFFVFMQLSGYLHALASLGKSLINTIIMVAILSPILLSSIYLSLFGRHKRQFLEIILGNFLSISLLATAILIKNIFSYGLDAFTGLGSVIFGYFLISFVLSFFLWILPGQWKKYRDQVEQS